MSFRPNPNAIRELRRDAAYLEELERAAERALRGAEHAAPIGETEDYIHSLGVVDFRGRPVLRSNDFAAHLVEYGSANNSAYAPLRRGVRAAGLDLRESPK